MRPLVGTQHTLARFWDIVPRRTDQEVVHAAAGNSHHGQKFSDLYFHGGRDKYKYISASEADLALVNIVVKHTDSPQQVGRIWRASRLAQHKYAL
jgi:primase-polymerase (primpol)-like protein